MHKIRHAIILAAGRGKRLRPYTNTTPKPLLPVDGVPIIEYMLSYLKQKGIDDITIITGYRARQFDYLVQKYGVALRRNKDFNHGSNLLSLKLAVDKIDDCVILDGDLLLKHDAIRSEVKHSGYSYVKRNHTQEWTMTFDHHNHICFVSTNTRIVKNNANALYSISYWVGDTAKKYAQAIKDAKDNVKYADDIAITMPDLYGYKVKASDLIEIDTVEDYEHVAKIQR